MTEQEREALEYETVLKKAIEQGHIDGISFHRKCSESKNTRYEHHHYIKEYLDIKKILLENPREAIPEDQGAGLLAKLQSYTTYAGYKTNLLSGVYKCNYCGEVIKLERTVEKSVDNGHVCGQNYTGPLSLHNDRLFCKVCYETWDKKDIVKCIAHHRYRHPDVEFELGWGTTLDQLKH